MRTHTYTLIHTHTHTYTHTHTEALNAALTAEEKQIVGADSASRARNAGNAGNAGNASVAVKAMGSAERTVVEKQIVGADSAATQERDTETDTGAETRRAHGREGRPLETLSQEVCVCMVIKRAMVCKAKEAYMEDKRGLYGSQKRPIWKTKEAYM